MYDDARLRQRIKQEREARGWTQTDLAKQLGKHGISCNQQTIVRIETTSRSISAAEVAALADIFDMPTDVLLGQLPRPAADHLGYVRRALVSAATNVERLLNEMTETLGSIVGTARDADPDGVLSAQINLAKSLHASLSAALLVARQIVREEQDR